MLTKFWLVKKGHDGINNARLTKCKFPWSDSPLTPFPSKKPNISATRQRKSHFANQLVSLSVSFSLIQRMAEVFQDSVQFGIHGSHFLKKSNRPLLNAEDLNSSTKLRITPLPQGGRIHWWQKSTMTPWKGSLLENKIMISFFVLTGSCGNEDVCFPQCAESSKFAKPFLHYHERENQS